MHILVTIAHDFSSEANSKHGSNSAPGRSTGLLEIELMGSEDLNLKMPVIPAL